MKDYYYILGVNKNSSIKEIKDAYRKLSKKFHPDLNDGDIFFEQRFKEIQEAYENLINISNSSSSEYKNSNNKENEGLPKIIVFQSDKNVYYVGDTINLFWESYNGNFATLNLFGKVELSGKKQFVINEPKANLELVLLVKNNTSSVSKSVIIEILENQKPYNYGSLNINYWYFILPIIIAFFVYREFNNNNSKVDYQNAFFPESTHNNSEIDVVKLNETTIFSKFYSSDPMYKANDIDRIRLFNKPFNILQNYYDSFISVDEVSKVKEFYPEIVLIHHNDEFIGSTKAVEKDINNYKNEGIESFRIFVQPNDMITDFYDLFDISSTSVNFYIQKINGKQIKISKKIYTILNKENTKILGISSKKISSNSIHEILNRNNINEDESNNEILENDVKMISGQMPYSYCYGKGYDCINYCSQIKVKVSGDADVIVVIKKDREVFRHVFIEKENSYTINVPNGNYQPFFYSGNGWNPNKFIRNAECGELIGGFQNNESVGKDDVQYLNNSILTYELIPQRNGNFNTKSSSKIEMF